MNEVFQDFVGGKLRLKILDTIVIAEFVGEFGFFDYTLLLQYLDELAVKYKTIILNMCSVEKIAATALGSFIAFKKKKVNLKLVCPKNSPVSLVLEMIHLSHFFDVYSSIEEALKSVQEKINEGNKGERSEE